MLKIEKTEIYGWEAGRMAYYVLRLDQISAIFQSNYRR